MHSDCTSADPLEFDGFRSVMYLFVRIAREIFLNIGTVVLFRRRSMKCPRSFLVWSTVLAGGVIEVEERRANSDRATGLGR